MRRNGYIVLTLAVVAWATVAIVLATGNPSGARPPIPPSGPSPACLPATPPAPYESPRRLHAAMSPIPGDRAAHAAG